MLTQSFAATSSSKEIKKQGRTDVRLKSQRKVSTPFVTSQGADVQNHMLQDVLSKKKKKKKVVSKG